MKASESHPSIRKNSPRKWTIEKIREGFELFHSEHGRYPTALEIDKYEHLPSSRQIQRSWGGLPKLREQLKLTGPMDFTAGEYRSKTVKGILERGYKAEAEIYEFLVGLFGEHFVHREYFFMDDHRVRADFYVHHKQGGFIVDVFYPKDMHNLVGCLNSKLRTYRHTSTLVSDPIIFLMMNAEIDMDDVGRAVELKKNKLAANQKVMDYKQFKDYCGSKKRLRAE